jgi:hypothetical protein
MTTSDQQTVTVSLPGEWAVPESFEAAWTTLDEYRLRVRIGVHMIDGQPHVGYLVMGTDPADPHRRFLSDKDLRRVDLVAMLDAAVRDAAWHTTPKPPITLADIEQLGGQGLFDLWMREFQSAHTAARRARRRRITSELLAEVLELHEKGGIHLVMEELGYSERNARRLLARARKENTE